eukprot:UN01413
MITQSRTKLKWKPHRTLQMQELSKPMVDLVGARQMVSDITTYLINNVSSNQKSELRQMESKEFVGALSTILMNTNIAEKYT